MNIKHFFKAPPITPEFIDYIIQKIMKLQYPLYHIIHTSSKHRRGDISEDPFELLQKSITNRELSEKDIVISKLLPEDFEKPPSIHTVILINTLNIPNSIPSIFIGIIIDRFMYDSKLNKNIVTKLIPDEMHKPEIYTNINALKKKTKKEIDKSPVLIDTTERFDAVIKAYNKQHTIIHTLLNLFEANKYNPLDISFIKQHIPSFQVFNYNHWDRQHSIYKIGTYDSKTKQFILCQKVKEIIFNNGFHSE